MDHVERNGVSVFVKEMSITNAKAAQFAWAISAVLQKLSPPPTEDSKNLVSGLKSWIKPSEAEHFSKTQWQTNSTLRVVLC